MKILYALLGAGFLATKPMPKLTVEAILSPIGTLPKALQGNNIATHILTTMVNFELTSLLLGIVTLILTAKILTNHGLKYEMPIILASVIPQAVVANLMNIQTVGMTAVIAACAGFVLMFSIKINTIRLSRNLLCCAGAFFAISPHTSLLGVAVGTAVGVILAASAKYERNLSKLLIIPPTNQVALAPGSKPDTVEDIFGRYNFRRAA